MAAKLHIRLTKVTLAIALAVIAQSVSASSCTEKPTHVIVHSDGNVYFTTESSCSNWCQLPQSWGVEQVNRAYSAILTAISQQRALTFAWPTQTTSCAVLATFSSPDSVLF